jgi:predicted RNase H-like HicB family nuclease
MVHFLLENLEPKGEIPLVNLKTVTGPGEDGCFVAHCPSLNICRAEGKSRKEALENGREATDLYLEPLPTDLATEMS